MRAALTDHDDLLRSTVEAHRGHVFKHTGDGVCAVFSSAQDAVAAAEAAQVSLELPVRMGIHVGEVEARDGDYFGPPLNRTARVMDAGHGRQILLSEAAIGLLGADGFIDLGSHKLRDLGDAQHIFQVGDGEFPPLRTVDAYPGNLPSALDSFVGRVDEVAELKELLDSHRLVTLTGVGGVGKTRLALQAAAELLPRFPQGCWLVELAPVADEAAVPGEIAQSLGIQQRAAEPPVETVVLRLREQKQLIVLDNCEHLLDAAADAVERILRECHDVCVIATSREGLGVPGEHMVAVRSLGNDARELFLERAAAANPAQVADLDLAVVDELCARLDGVPLAIELAAARTRSMSLTEILERLDQRFRLLRGGRRRVERHQTIRGAIEWSYDLLSEDEQWVFNRLGAFAGSFSSADAEFVVADGERIDELDVLDHLDSLVVKSMLQVDTAGGSSRYRLLETLRQYAVERLVESGEEIEVRDRHAELCLSVAATLIQQAFSPNRVAALAGYTNAADEIRSALDWLVERGRFDDAVSLLDLSGQYWTMRDMDEGLRRAEQLLAHRDDLSHQGLVMGLATAANLAYNAGYVRRAREFGEEALTLSDGGDREYRAKSVGGLMTGLIYTADADMAIAVGMVELESLRESKRAAVVAPDAEVTVLMNLAMASFHRPAEAVRWTQEALMVADEMGDPMFKAASHTCMARALIVEDPRTALAEANLGLELGGNFVPHMLSTLHAIVAWVRAGEGRVEEASTSMLSCLQETDAMGIHYLLGFALVCGARVYGPVDPVAAAGLIGARQGLYDTLECQSPSDETILEDMVLESLRHDLTEVEVEEALAAGRELNVEQAADLIRDLAARVG